MWRYAGKVLCALKVKLKLFQWKCNRNLIIMLVLESSHVFNTQSHYLTIIKPLRVLSKYPTTNLPKALYHSEVTEQYNSRMSTSHHFLCRDSNKRFEAFLSLSPCITLHPSNTYRRDLLNTKLPVILLQQFIPISIRFGIYFRI